MLSSWLIASLLSVSVFAERPSGKRCDIRHANLALPSNQAVLPAPSGAPSFIAAAIGVQNYTCNPTTGKYASAGAVAQLFDVSCLYDTPMFDTVQDTMFHIWSQIPEMITIQDVIEGLGSAPVVLGQHYFVPNPKMSPYGGPAAVPKWDFTSASEKGKKNAYILGSVVGDLQAPTGIDDVDWLFVKNVSGHLADFIYRVDTKSGQLPATSCTPGSPLLSVKYAAKYWFFGGSVEH
ncbi:hypothetical protein APHAL10511_007025 [Amanita phalloides]|nr:hypothetical protein APHAL10511_007025 [Amanita phalloides]